MAPRRLSSRTTVFYKFGLPVLIIVWLAVSLWVAVRSAGPDATGLDAFVGIFSLVAVSAVGVLLWLFAPLKQVTLDGDTLVISNFRDVVRVPLRDVERVTASRWTNPESIRLDLQTPSGFGSRIVFLPPLRWVRGFSPHPLAAELAGLVQAQRLEMPHPLGAPEPVAWRRLVFGALILAAIAGAISVALFTR